MITIKPARAIRCDIDIPGDKSISHRAALMGALSHDGIDVENFSHGEDCVSTLSCLMSLGVNVEKTGDRVHISRGDAFREPCDVLDAGNSGTTARTLCGLLAGIPGLYAVLNGDDSLRKRPMSRVVDPLRIMGAKIDGRSSGAYLPVCIKGTRLTGGVHHLPVASAQVKTALLLSGLSAHEPTTVFEPLPTRDHTEILFKFLGIPLSNRDGSVTAFPCDEFRGGRWKIPGDVSSAAFWMAAAAILPDSDVRIRFCGLNPTRAGVIDVLRRMGLSISFENECESGGERVGDIVARSAKLEGTKIDFREAPILIDELPVIAVVATQATGVTEIRGARELRVKESDRIAAITEGLLALGADVKELDDGWIIKGPSKLRGGKIKSYGDHRIAMAFAIAGLAADSHVEIDDDSCVGISYPSFFDTLEMAAIRNKKR